MYLDAQIIRVTITDLVPRITSSGGLDEATLYLPKGTIHVTTVVAEHLDNNNPLTYSILEESDHETFYINSTTGFIGFVNERVPTETSTFTIKVKATSTAASDTQLINVIIIDDTNITLVENTQEVGPITPTTTPPQGANLTYSVAEHDAGVFEITPQGVLRFKDEYIPDYEIPKDDRNGVRTNGNNDYWTLVTISDGGSFTNTQLIKIAINNVNEAPRITSSSTFTVAENQSAVATLTATDTDAGDAATFSETIIGADAEAFTLTPAGVLTFNSNSIPDFETKHSYSITVTANDENGGSGTQDITITITNVNEAPVITFQNGASEFDLDLDENTQAVATITATDVDANTTLIYSLSQHDSGVYDITQDGVLTFKSEYIPNYEIPRDDGSQLYRTVVTVSDGTLSDAILIKVIIRDVNEAVPDISVSPSELTFTAGTPVTTNPITITNNGGAIVDYTVRDANGQSLFANTGGLGIIAISGIISGTPTISFSATTYTIAANNVAGTSTADITITVNAADAPSIRITPATVMATAGTAITPITIDSTGGGAVVSYRIDPAIGNGLLFDETTGSISGTPTVVGSTSYTITAMNTGGSNDATVTITVNEAAPRITIRPR